MEQQELVRAIERRRRKARAKRLYRKILTTRVAPAVCLILVLGVLAKFGVTKILVNEGEQTATVQTHTATLRIADLTDFDAENGALLISGVLTQGVSLGATASDGDSTLAATLFGELWTSAVSDAAEMTEESQEEEAYGAFEDVFLVDGISGLTCVNIRSDADITSDILGKLYEGAGGTVLEYDSEWCYVQSGSVTGYVCTDYILTGDALELELLLDGELTVSPNEDGDIVRIYADLDSESEELGELTDTANVVSVSRYYIGIEYGDGIGYVLRSRVAENVPAYTEAVSIEEEEASESLSASIAESESAEQASQEAEAFASIFTETSDTVYAIANVNIRASYSEDSKIVGYLFVGDEVTRTAIGNNGWDQVSYYGVTAYICSEYISTTDPLETTTQQTTTQQTTTQKQTTTQQTTTQKQTTTQQTTTEQTTTQQTTTVSNVSAVSLTENEILMLAAMIYCEAGGESWEGKLAVGDVILNRLRSGYWGDTLEDVLSAAGQFSPYASGRYAEVLAAGPSSSCIKAARAAASGEMVVPSNYMFFCSASSYSYRYSDYMLIGNVIFYAR